MSEKPRAKASRVVRCRVGRDARECAPAENAGALTGQAGTRKRAVISTDIAGDCLKAGMRMQRTFSQAIGAEPLQTRERVLAAVHRKDHRTRPASCRRCRALVQACCWRRRNRVSGSLDREASALIAPASASPGSCGLMRGAMKCIDGWVQRAAAAATCAARHAAANHCKSLHEWTAMYRQHVTSARPASSFRFMCLLDSGTLHTEGVRPASVISDPDTPICGLSRLQQLLLQRGCS